MDKQKCYKFVPLIIGETGLDIVNIEDAIPQEAHENVHRWFLDIHGNLEYAWLEEFGTGLFNIKSNTLSKDLRDLIGFFEEVN